MCVLFWAGKLTLGPVGWSSQAQHWPHSNTPKMNWRQWLETLLDSSQSEIAKQCQKHFPAFELSSASKEWSGCATPQAQPWAGPSAHRHWTLLAIRSMDSSRSLYWKKSLIWCLWASASTKASRLSKFRCLHPAYLIQHWEHPFQFSPFGRKWWSSSY